MRTVLVVLSGLLIFSGVVSVTLWRDLKAARQLTTDANAQLTGAKTHLQEGTSAPPPVVAEPSTVITATAVPSSKYDSPPIKAPLPSQPATSNQERERLLTREEVAKAEQRLEGTPFTVNQTGQMMAKPSTIMTSNDLNKDGVITKEEAKTANRPLIRIWNRYDLNKDDMVDEAEIAKASGM